MRGSAAALLVLEAIVVLLGTLTAVTTTDLDPAAGWAGGGLLALLCVLAAGMLRRGSVGVVLGSVAQLLAVASGFLVPVMFFLGAIFAGLWVLAIVLGRRIEAARAPTGVPAG